MNIIELNAIKTIPDIVHEYSPSLKSNSVPLIIDNGEKSNMFAILFLFEITSEFL